MRVRCMVVLLPLLALAACGGDTRPATVGSSAPPSGSGGSGGGVGSGGSSPTPTPANFLDVSTQTSFDALGSFQALNQTTTAAGTATVYTGNAATVNAPSGTISYNPRDAVFTLTIADSTANVNRDLRFQDPAHRVEFTPAEFAAKQIPNLNGFNYLQVFDGVTTPIFFYQRPGTQTNYVSLGGYSRTAQDVAAGSFNAERGVFVFGQRTPTAQIPASGTGTFTGGFVASMVFDQTGGGASYLQWVNGSSTATVDFGARTVALRVGGTVGEAYAQGVAVNPTQLSVAAGSTFTASGTASINMVQGGFSGAFRQNVAANGSTPAQNNVGFTLANGSFLGVNFASVAAGGSTAGASSIDGAFFGPNAVNLGGDIRIVGGVPNQRVDIMGAFTGAKQP